MTGDDDWDRVRMGLEMAYAGISQGVEMMPPNCMEARALEPLLKDLRHVLGLEEPAK